MWQCSPTTKTYPTSMNFNDSSAQIAVFTTVHLTTSSRGDASHQFSQLQILSWIESGSHGSVGMVYFVLESMSQLLHSRLQCKCCGWHCCTLWVMNFGQPLLTVWFHSRQVHSLDGIMSTLCTRSFHQLEPGFWVGDISVSWGCNEIVAVFIRFLKSF
jgi:hypothetical protein